MSAPHPDRDLVPDPELRHDPGPDPEPAELPDHCECDECQDECCRPSAMMLDLWSRA